jgi:glycosyltransferase involved in cell wall biosynthesis
MRIAQIAPLIESVPPRLYGGTERVVSQLTEELVRQGHDVTLFASGDSRTSADLVACSRGALRHDENLDDPIALYTIMLDRVRARMHEFDILHFHFDYFHFPTFRANARRTLTTLHGRLDLPACRTVLSYFQDMPLVSISDAQRKPVPRANFVATIHHGIPVELHVPVIEPRGGYLAFLGRICPEKRVDRAIEIARKAGMRLKIAAKIDKVDEEYFRERIAPLLDGPDVEFVGEIDERGKSEFLGQAQAVIFPIDWPEPFGLVMIEAMACGTPVLAFRCGSVSEIIEPDVTGCIVETVEEALAALPRVLALDRRRIRRRFEARFTAERMACDYVTVYRTLMQAGAARDERRPVEAVAAFARRPVM